MTCAKCDRPADRESGRRGLCWSHYWEWRVSRDPATVVRRTPAAPCGAEGCDRDARTKGYCDTHYRRLRKYGDPCAPDRSTRARRKPPTPPVVVDTAARIEDCEWMAEHGENLNGAAARIGISPDGLAKWLSDNGRPDLRRTLVARNPSTIADADALERRVKAWHESRRRKQQEAAA